MKLQFTRNSRRMMCDVFAGQPCLTPSYMMDKGYVKNEQITIDEAERFTGFGNSRLVPELNDGVILQRSNQIELSRQWEGRNLTVEMETGVGKTYTYIETMYEINKRYCWSKFIVVVPSVAIHEEVYKSFQITEEHFAEENGKKIQYIIYNSAQLVEIDRLLPTAPST